MGSYALLLLPSANRVYADAAHVRDVLDACERLVSGRPEVELLATRRRVHGDDD